MFPDGAMEVIVERALKELYDARQRQFAPGQYALLHANGMPFAEMVELISSDAVLVAYNEPEEDGF